MNPDEEIKIDCLGPSDSWALFMNNVGTKALYSHPGVLGLARQVAAECGGLPLALATLGKVMSSTYGLQRWEFALDLLQSYPYEFKEME